MLRNALEPWHLLLVVAAIALLFGSKKLPDLARGLGRSMRILKAETRALHDDEPQPDAAPAPLPTLEPATPTEATTTQPQQPTTTT
ncbi:Sec-independent protein translocase subunit TatA [Kitasatospora sp. MBT66]|uniref:Sec-independent protein translocase subunit TatA n=1 Tax=Kitasatospora sp. MBT66 TaxID=1444769 RepID=UPI0005B80952|nr:Sec-independent protein translocase subunit TatA [Kitasatospora sp. MBT66]